MRDPNENRELSPLDRPARNNRGWGLSWPVHRNEKVVTLYSGRLKPENQKLDFVASPRSSTLHGKDGHWMCEVEKSVNTRWINASISHFVLLEKQVLMMLNAAL